MIYGSVYTDPYLTSLLLSVWKAADKARKEGALRELEAETALQKREEVERELRLMLGRSACLSENFSRKMEAYARSCNSRLARGG